MLRQRDEDIARFLWQMSLYCAWLL